ncbi:hypothetical protein WA026_019206 [Henosepilachna vigintioctopunctata]|uniref:Nose resistant-to-fluoxetine protein N-terminal domain-containing protein n=1 Tax=Henosepilachna vigintioctopunctata TaxID=420089 RepID=A0AAW1V4Z5_9CUCU
MNMISLVIIFSLVSSSLSMGVLLDTVNILKDTVDMTQLDGIVPFLEGISPLYNLVQQSVPQELWKTSEPCRKQVSLLLEGIKNNDLWALQMLDASAKLEAGIFYGNHFIFGSYDECIEIKHRYNDNNSEDVIKGQYCTAAVLYKGSKSNLSHKKNQTARQVSILILSS